MSLGRKSWSLLFILTTALFLTACNSVESKLIGSWKSVVNGETGLYIEIGKDRIINRSETHTVAYILTETEGDTFILEIIPPENNVPIIFFEGYFENNDTITAIATADGPIEDDDGEMQFIRVDDIAEDQAKEEARIEEEKQVAEQRAQVEAEREKKREETEAAREAAKKGVKKDNEIHAAQSDQKEKEATPQNESIQQEYLQKADAIRDEIMDIGIELGHQDLDPRLYVGYYDEWDDLLNEVWGVIRETMDEKEFEPLLQEQRAWLAKIEEDFAGKSDHSAYEREEAYGYLVFQRQLRTYELIENHMP